MIDRVDQDQLSRLLSEMGPRGAVAPAKKLSPECRKEIARKASKAAAKVRSEKAAERKKRKKQ